MSLPGYNVTVDPSALATPVEDPEITDIIDLVTGEIIETASFIGRRAYAEVVAQRMHVREALAREDPTHACALCWTPVYLVASMRKRFFFRHTHEDGSCRAHTRHGLTEAQIRARKYHGLRESEAHKRIKNLVVRSLKADPAFATESILTETRWTAEGDSTLWRQPDVQARSAAGRFAFEAQLSTTFLDVVAARRVFYQNEGATLVWVLAQFDPEYRRMTTDDLLFSNNSNVFVVDEESTRVSEERQRFHLWCHYRRPYLGGDAVCARWEKALVCFHDLVIEPDRSRIYYVDFDGEEERLNAELDQALRDEFKALWVETMAPHFDGLPESMDRWLSVKKRLARRGVAVPDHPSGDSSFRSLMHGVLSAVKGAPVGWEFAKLIQVAHHLAFGHPQNLLAFGHALKITGHDKRVEAQDVTGKWARKRREEIKPGLKARDPKYVPDMAWLPALSFLFPEVGVAVKSYLEQHI